MMQVEDHNRWRAIAVLAKAPNQAFVLMDRECARSAAPSVVSAPVPTAESSRIVGCP